MVYLETLESEISSSTGLTVTSVRSWSPLLTMFQRMSSENICPGPIPDLDGRLDPGLEEVTLRNVILEPRDSEVRIEDHKEKLLVHVNSDAEFRDDPELINEVFDEGNDEQNESK